MRPKPEAQAGRNRHMQSQLLVQYLRTGAISPLNKSNSKGDVEAKLGPPDDWKGRTGGIGWEGPLFTDFHESWAWHYGSLCVCFPYPGLFALPGISLIYSSILRPIVFPPPFEDLPQTVFTLGEIIELLRVHDIRFTDNRSERQYDAVIVSEGGVGVGTLHGKCLPMTPVTYLYPHEYSCV